MENSSDKEKPTDESTKKKEDHQKRGKYKTDDVEKNRKSLNEDENKSEAQKRRSSTKSSKIKIKRESHVHFKEYYYNRRISSDVMERNRLSTRSNKDEPEIERSSKHSEKRRNIGEYEDEEVKEREMKSVYKDDEDASEDEAPIYYMDPEPRTPAELSTEKAGVCKRMGYEIIIYVILGYILGIMMVILWYAYVLKKNQSDLNVKWWFIVLAVLSLLILCYSRATRCVLVLTVPTLCSYKGRALLIALAFLIAAMGPVMNIIKNIGILGYSLSCGQSHLKQALIPMVDLIREPIHGVEHAVFLTIHEVRRTLERLEVVLQRLEVAVINMFRTYRSCEQWLIQHQVFFESHMGTPYDRCLSAGNFGIKQCRTHLGSQKCNASQQIEWFCEHLKDLKSFFDKGIDMQQQAFNEIFEKLQHGFVKVRQIFEVSIKFEHKRYNKTTEDSSDLDNKISAEMESQKQNFVFLFIWLDAIILILIIAVLLRSIYFRMRYLGSNDIGNVYLTAEFFAYDEEQQRFGISSLLPLRASEAVKYVKLNSFRLLPIEFSYITRSLLFMIITCTQLFCICFTEYCIFWMLALMSKQAHEFQGLEAPAYTKVLIRNGGMIGSVLRGLVQAFEPLSQHYFIDMKQCVPYPELPNYLRYYEIFALCMLAWFLLFWEPYGLRWRHRIMSWFYPDEAGRRARFLYHRICLDRDNFIKMARRRARAIHRYDDHTDRLFGMKWICALWNCCSFLRLASSNCCIICSKPLDSSNSVKCDTVGCTGIYCQSCFSASYETCCLCGRPSDYGDNSDLSEIGDSSDDPEAEPYRPDNIYCEQLPSD